MAATLGLAALLSSLLVALLVIQGRIALRESTAIALDRSEERVRARVEQLLRSAEMTAESAAALTRHRTVGAEDFLHLFAQLVPALQQRPELTFLGYALAATGEYGLLERRADGELWLRLYVNHAGGPVIRDHRWTGQAFEFFSERPNPDYDPRRRPFFIQAAQVGRPVWTSGYEFVARPGEVVLGGISYVIPVKSPDGSLVGVWDADFNESTLHEFTRQLRRETGAHVFIVEQSPEGKSTVLAHPAAGVPGADGGLVTAERAAKGDPLIGPLLERGRMSFNALAPHRVAAIGLPVADGPAHAGGYFLLDATRWPRWFVGLALPPAALDASFRRLAQALLIAAGAITFLAVGAGWWFSRRLARPLEALRSSAENLDLDRPVAPTPELTGVRELDALATSFARMVGTMAERQHALAQTNGWLQAIIDHVPAHIWALDTEGRYLLQNRSARQQMGAQVGRLHRDLDVDPVLLRTWAAENRRALAGEIVHGDATDTPPDRSRHWHYVIAPVRDPSTNAVTGLVGLSFDVTELRQAELQLEFSQRRLKSHLAHTPLGAVDWDAQLAIVGWNPAAEHIFGWTAAEVIGQRGLFFATDKRGELPRAWQALAARGGSTRHYCRHELRDGQQIDCEWYATAITDENGVITGISALVLDVTQRVSAERLFREAEERFRAAFEQNPAPIAIVRVADQRILDVNAEWQAAFGYDRAAAVRSTLDDLALFRDEEQVGLFRHLVAREAGVHDCELRMRTRRGIERTMLVSTARIEIGREPCALCMHVDATDRLKAEDDLRQLNQTLEKRVARRTAALAEANARLKEVDRLKSEFLATMSHELRTPLNSILGFSGILRAGRAGPVTTEQVRQLDFVLQSGRHLLGLINDLLDLSRIEAGRFEINASTFAPADVLLEIERTLSPLVAGKALRYATHLPAGGEALTIISDRQRVYQVVLNLAGNAVKFTERGSVDVTLVARADGGVEIAVRDTGPGIPAAQQGRLFEAFRQLEGTRRRDIQGAGLGLHLVKRFLTLLGGDVTFTSEPGVGSCFTCRLPLAPPDTAPPPTSLQ